MNILITGGAGFIGTNLIKRLLQDGHSVTSIDDYSTGIHANHQKGCEYIFGKIEKCNLHAIESEFDMVYHLASIARIQPSFERPREYFDVNVNGTINVIEYCIENDIPMIYAGSSSVHGGKFENPYTFSKDVAEDTIKMYGEHFGLKYAITRFYNVYGDHQILGGDYSTLIGRWLYNIDHGLDCEIYGDGEKRRDFTHVDDIVDALILVMQNKAYGYTFELGRGINHSINEVAKMFGITPIYKPSKDGEVQVTLNTDNTAKEVLNWNPTRNLEDYAISKKNKSKILV